MAVPPTTDIIVAPITSTSQLPDLFACAAAAFGSQTHDLIWTAFNPHWDTPTGLADGAARLATRWETAPRVTHNPHSDASNDRSVTILEARAPSPDGTGTAVAGIAIWVQASLVPGWGEPPTGPTFEARRAATGLEALYPHDEATQRWLAAVDAGLHAPRTAVLRAKAAESTPAAYVLDLCAVRPEWQGRGVGAALVAWGVSEAGRRGGLECLTEASVMGRRVYEKVGFRVVRRIEYGVEEELGSGRGELPDNVFMRTGARGS
ncbi:uncharacterized protein HMPREF1541_06287 [Cyphellophora europaea CBS 101466]|uniref:N-acetyltransferase domain-containing protein n=1 Tax=Cyphellophora europaea (strain CBS 101466) TaxID=1220924 RepID=W2RNZ5_CYPE1|nr:uncharacterized protein HMPREF1541_06287 [Cyphellophora europaea CBS 101466]ETN38256.1 hypothetical protein HMPREF1541_06287 [Cyphellophora europaea CBS 101466]